MNQGMADDSNEIRVLVDLAKKIHTKEDHSCSFSRDSKRNKIADLHDLLSWYSSYIEPAADGHKQIIQKSCSIRWKLVYTETNKSKRCQKKLVYPNLPIPKQKKLKLTGKNGSIN